MLMDSGRRSHQKSRKGCIQCKKRKIKCGEERPQCSNCVRHKTKCLFISTSSSPAGSSSTATTPLQSGALPPGKRVGLEPDNGDLSAWTTQFNMIEMELLHNYSTFTCHTLDRNPAIITVWRVNIPQVAFSFSFVMSAVLSISALHLSFSRPHMKEQYVALALQHHERGLSRVNAILPTVTETNCSAVYIFSALTSMISLAKPRGPDDFLLMGQEGLADWLLLLRGTKHIIDTYQDILLNGSLGPMLHVGLRRLTVWMQAGEFQHAPLEDLVLAIRNVVHDDGKRDMYVDTIKSLRQSFYLLANTALQASDTADVFIWFFNVGDEYLDCLYAREQVALAIFGFYCVVLKELEWSWYVKGWSTHLIAVIWRNLDPEHRTWIQWPVEQIGWVPT